MLVMLGKNHNNKDNNNDSSSKNNNNNNKNNAEVSENEDFSDLWQTGRFSPEVMLKVRFPDTIWSKSAQA